VVLDEGQCSVKRIILGGIVAMATLIGATVALPAQAATDSFTEHDLATGDVRASGITNGPDGAMWFTEFAAEKIGRITTSGAITTFDVASNSQLPRIVTGNDGNLWFTVDSPADKVGRITPTGTVTLFNVPGVNSRPFGIALGADGKLWIGEQGIDEVGRIDPLAADPAASLIGFPSPVGSQPSNLTTGPDGAVWFVADTKVDRMTTAGVVTDQFDVTDAGAVVELITTGSDGNLWFLAQVGNTLSRLTPSGVLTVYPLLHAASGPSQPITGPDGAIWFTESNRIGRFEPPAPITTPTTGGTTTSIGPPASGVKTTPAFTG
jgi:virginiamycin B lyase